MLSPVSLQLLQKHNFEVKQTDTFFEVIHRKPINWVWPVFSVQLGLVALPLLAFGNFKLGLLVILLLIYPVYQLFQNLKQPKRLCIDNHAKSIDVETKDHKTNHYSFDEVASIVLNTFDEHLEPNAFRDEVVVRHFYIELLLSNDSQKTIMVFKEAEHHLLEDFIIELKTLMAPTSPQRKKVKA